MEEEQRLELISHAIKRLLEDNKNKKSSDRSSVDDGDENGNPSLLRDLLSQIESLKEGTESDEFTSALDTLKTKVESFIKEEIVDDECSREDIVKELKKLKRQNLLTHCLLSVMIVLTIVWQLSEVSIILNVKDKISHPFRSLGNFISGMFKRPKTIVDNTDKNSSRQDNDEVSLLPPLKIPELPHMGLQ
ncbi:hypothetical protein IC582_027276 [Cucumis melo]|uniref:Uncharacterized protein LOC103498843 n=2 Tax=Cucumis melo TaxID=3656 RepID=A0A1S3CAM6_CUCME|nr:uncharacterized protein LOC103498843 [Cucumis melo]KAA0039810.1 uncharacterized protein E6C27_scaffold122G00830 [Cucumis melo var. makuwa]TYK24687.1 uncharacterized protein E5676_scaffold266G002400 [Cucumis melo var. makuwa]